MNGWSQRLGNRLGTWVMLVVTLSAIVGCSKGDPESPAEVQPYAASGGVPDGTPEPESADQVIATQSTTPATDPPDSTGAQSDEENQAETVAESAPTRPPSQPDPLARIMPPESARNVVTPFTIEGSEEPEPKTATLTELKPDLNPKQLRDFLAAADSDMQLIVMGRSGIENPQQARKTLLHIVKMKLEASRRLAAHAEADDADRSEGARGELQSLSHLAALGDVKSAEQLEELALTHLESADPKLVSDSRLVLIGFAIESLQNGDEDAPERIVRYIDQIATSATPPDVAAMMVMGQARESLDRYGHDQASRLVRDRIIELFADSPEPEIAEMAARMAGNVRFDGIDTLLNQVLDGEDVEVEQWKAAAQQLINESADLQTVQYLGGAALELEARNRNELADATYELLRSRFDDPSSATGQEVAMAVEAYQARQDVIGQVFSPDLDSVDGRSLALTDYRDKVVLIPFWAMSFPQSLQVVPQLKSIVNEFPDRVSIVGVNLDAEGEPVAEFVQTNQLGFPSFRAPTSPTDQVANPVAAKFGIVSMPFTAIVGTDGRIVEIDFTGQKLQKTVADLLAE